MKKHFLILGGIFAVLLVTAFGYSRLQSPTTEDLNTLKVVGSFYPLAHFAEQVGGDRVQVINIVPTGSEPHDFEPTPQDIATIQAAQLFVMNGSGLDPWAERLQPELEDKGVTVLRMSDTVELINGQDEHADEEQAGEGHTEEGGSEGESTDPHFWLDPVLAQKEVEAIADALAEIDPTNADYYLENAANYSQQLAILDRAYEDGLAQCAKREIITSHAAFGYLAKRYNITVHAIAGLSPDQEPSARQLSQLTELAREKDIHYIFFETLVSPRLAETIANEVGAQTLVFNPLEGLTDDELQAGENYISVMEDNLQNLRTAMECQ